MDFWNQGRIMAGSMCPCPKLLRSSAMPLHTKKVLEKILDYWIVVQYYRLIDCIKLRSSRSLIVASRAFLWLFDNHKSMNYIFETCLKCCLQQNACVCIMRMTVVGTDWWLLLKVRLEDHTVLQIVLYHCHRSRMSWHFYHNRIKAESF